VFKGLTPIVIGLALLAHPGQWSNPTVWSYFSMHGTYGKFWPTDACVPSSWFNGS
jgi:hypothetical protein